MDQSPNHRRLRRMAILAVATAAVVILTFGCDETKHYSTLSFFFDGVPDPNAPPPDLATLEITREDGTVIERDKPIVWHYHTPYENRNCFDCHDRDAGFDLSDAGSALCQQCHDTYFELRPDDWMHGPIQVEGCALCHEPHRSEYPGVLKAAQPDICFRCHDPNLFERSAFHAALEDRTCSRCHDPHSTGNRLLLIDSQSLFRRRRDMPPLDSPHAKWSRDTCAQCHMMDESNVLREDVSTVCISCHESVLDTSAGPLHEAITQRQCLTCHVGHKSTREHLIRPHAERNCYNCHSEDEVRQSVHPNMIRADCLICHAGHHADRDKLVKPLVALPWQSPTENEP
jgi:predicted CXXCH cytochrome family protein